MLATSFDPDMLQYLSDEERAELDMLLANDSSPWRPLAGPQLDAYYADVDILGYGGAAGGGKGLALDTDIPTLAGWKQMRDICVGDILFDEKGNACSVSHISEINHRPCYRLTFDDGTTVIADDVHRWVTFDAKELAALTRRDPQWRAKRRASRPSRATGSRGETVTRMLTERNKAQALAKDIIPPIGTMRDTLTLAHCLKDVRGRTNHAIPICGALHYPEQKLVIPPYVLGAWLGDGASASGQLTSADPDIWIRIESEGYKVVHYQWDSIQHNILGLKVQLRELGVLSNKHIPAQYLQASIDQRLALLQGLMDTDGYVAKDGGCEYDGVNEKLVRCVYELVMSLGIKATLRKGVARLNGKIISDKWKVKFVTTLPVCHLSRKAERLKTTTRRTATMRYLVSCEPVQSVPTKCIAVDSTSHQFLITRSFLPTHNTDLAAGKVLTQSSRALFIRREKAQTEGLVQRLTEILGSTDGLNAQKGIWKLPTGGLLELGGLDNAGDERRWQGRPHDKKIFDEVTEMREHQVRFIMGWNRTNDPDIKVQTIMTFNPPTTSDGRWVIEFFAPWLDKKHPLYPTPPGQIKYAAMVPGEDGNMRDAWLDRADKFVLIDGKPSYDFNPKDYKPEDIITPKSRTFIPARVTDNPYYMDSGYMSTLQSLPEPLRSQMLYGDFHAGIEDDPWQVIPTQWIEDAMARWTKPSKLEEMDSVGVDVARGGKDSTIIARRHGMWFDEPLVYPGSQTPDGPKVAGLAIAAQRDQAPIHIDVIGVGSSPFDFLKEAGIQVLGINVAEASHGFDKSGRLQFANLRSELYWRVREALDPTNNTGIALPPSNQLKADLCAFTWSLQGSKITVASREEIVKKVGRSPDYASAYILALIDTPKARVIKELIKANRQGNGGGYAGKYEAY